MARSDAFKTINSKFRPATAKASKLEARKARHVVLKTKLLEELAAGEVKRTRKGEEKTQKLNPGSIVEHITKALAYGATPADFSPELKKSFDWSCVLGGIRGLVDEHNSKKGRLADVKFSDVGAVLGLEDRVIPAAVPEEETPAEDAPAATRTPRRRNKTAA